MVLLSGEVSWAVRKGVRMRERERISWGFWPWVLGSSVGCFAERGGQLGCEEGCTDDRERG